MTEIDFDTWLASVPPNRVEETRVLDALFRDITGYQPRIWAGRMVGYGAYDYTYDSGHSGTSLATGFAPGKARISLYIMPGYADFSTILDRLGPHKTGKACLYITRLSRIDMPVLRELIHAGLQNLHTHWPVHP
ncbi:MAG: DUF1801 domain-containing protein [Pseudomonadota bacterium]